MILELQKEIQKLNEEMRELQHELVEFTSPPDRMFSRGVIFDNLANRKSKNISINKKEV